MRKKVAELHELDDQLHRYRSDNVTDRGIAVDGISDHRLPLPLVLTIEGKL